MSRNEDINENRAMEIIQSKERNKVCCLFYKLSIHIKGITFLREKNGLAEEIVAKNLNLVQRWKYTTI